MKKLPSPSRSKCTTLGCFHIIYRQHPDKTLVIYRNFVKYVTKCYLIKRSGFLKFCWKLMLIMHNKFWNWFCLWTNILIIQRYTTCSIWTRSTKINFSVYFSTIYFRIMLTCLKYKLIFILCISNIYNICPSTYTVHTTFTIYGVPSL